MKVLITGGSGLLGFKLREILEIKDYDVYSSFNNNPLTGKKSFQMDITKKENVEYFLNKFSPDVIIHTAAYTNVDECEKNKKLSFEINVKGTENVANAAEKINAKLVYISTDYIFNGKKGRYKENDDADPINYYGETKLKAENSVRDICSNFVIARTSVLYGFRKKNFVTWAIDMLRSGKNINIVNDQYVSPTLNIDLANQLIALIEQDETGIFHTAGGERINRYDFLKELCDIFSYNENLIEPISMSDMDWIALRPKDSSLNVLKISKFQKPYSIKKALMLLKEDMDGKK